ncbi:sensor domain-containing protein [Mycobacterium paragordonae]|uniref:sensor domain-containing protein n=1 Tax=Mycobacterium paragordonae TaxID=1389713 RepID=UPI0010606476|nr:sensor domain-containing protein [Mycobacterium paragordonae]TDL04092.1 sensor domain-containing protein [Mycobacterium paragordonae]
MEPDSSSRKNETFRASWFKGRSSIIGTTVTGAGRSVFVVACAIVVTNAGCSRDTTPAQMSTPPVSAVDSLIVSVEEVRRIANYDELASRSHADLRQPPPGDLNAPGPCRAAGTSDLTFASGWSEFRSAGYSGVTDNLEPGGNAMIDSVSQAVAMYPDTHAARQALNQLESSLTACVALHNPNYNFTLDHPDSSTLKITAPGWSHLYRWKNTVLMSVGVLGIEPAERIATDVLQVITDRTK